MVPLKKKVALLSSGEPAKKKAENYTACTKIAPMVADIRNGVPVVSMS
jgi:hypothetical protein